MAKQHKWRPAKLDDDFRDALRHALAGAQIKRNARPTPVVDEQLQRDEGFRVGIWRDGRFAAVANDTLALDCAGAVLPAHHVGEHFLGG